MFSLDEPTFQKGYMNSAREANRENLFYWGNRQGKAEVDFIVEGKDGIVPLEVKSGVNIKSKSLKVYDKKFEPEFLARASLLNFKKDGKIVNIPLYAINSFIKRL